MKLRVGQKGPDFTLPSHLGKDVSLSDLRGSNVILAFFPLAWTPVWTNQIPSYEADMAKFGELNAQVLGISVDHVPCLVAWAESLGGISYPLLSDFWPHGAVAQKYGVLGEEGFTERAIFILDKEGVIRYIDIHDINEQPSNEVLLAELRRIDPEAAAAHPPQQKREPVELPKRGIVLYCSKWCPDCRRVRHWLKERDLEFTEVDVNAVPEAAQQVREWADGSLITPTLDIDGTIVLDFDRERLAELLDK